MNPATLLYALGMAGGRGFVHRCRVPGASLIRVFLRMSGRCVRLVRQLDSATSRLLLPLDLPI